MSEPRELKGDWWTAPAEADDGRTILVTGRRDVARFRSNPRYCIRIELTWSYEGNADGMPDRATSELMEQVQDALAAEFDRDPVAVLTGIYTGAGERNWVFYTTSTHIFGRKLNEVLAPFPLLPISVYAENDPQWGEYDEMSECEIHLD